MCDFENPPQTNNDQKHSQFTLHQKVGKNGLHWLSDAGNYAYDPDCWWCQVRFILFGWTGA